MDINFKRKMMGKTIFITGGTGSFGNSVVEELLRCNPYKIIIFSRDEKKQFDMRNKFDNRLLKFVIGDVRDMESVSKAMKEVDYVFHAAALKQVPTCEFFPLEAIKTNVIGAYNVMTAATINMVKKVVVLSTDKAVYPINVIGLSKALMEKIMISESKTINDYRIKNTIFCGVRYGNVLYTRGSVVPYFIDLMKQKKKLTVTDFNMTRFLLPLKEAVNLVLYSLVYGENGCIYVKKASVCTLEVLAQALCKIFNYKKGIIEVGIRSGEKMHETLVTGEESLRAEDLGDYYKILPESQGLDYNKYFTNGEKSKGKVFKPYTSENTKRLNVEETIEILKSVPELNKELKHD